MDNQDSAGASTSESMVEYLKSWGLDMYIQKFTEQSIDLDCIQLLTEADIKELVPVVGHRVKMMAQIKTLQNLMSQTNRTPSVALPKHDALENQPICINIQDREINEYQLTDGVFYISEEKSKCELYTILNGTNEGKSLLLKYQNSGLLDNGARRKLCNIIITHELQDDPNKKITSSRFYNLSHQITLVFHKEKQGVYFIPYANYMAQKQAAKGKLLDCYRQKRREFIQSGVIDKSIRDSPSTSSPRQDAINNLGYFIDSEVDVEEYVQWLKNNISPWQKVEEYWEKTSKYRLKVLSDPDIVIGNYFNTYKGLKQPGGIFLILQDFKKLYPEITVDLDITWPVIANKVIALMEKKKRCHDSAPLLLELGEINQSSEEQVNLAAFMCLPFLMATSNTKNRKEKENRGTHQSRKPWKDSLHTSKVLVK